MSKLNLAVLAAVMVAAIACGQAAADVKTELANVDVSALPKANAQLATNLYGRLAEKDGNLFFSPYSISEAMAMTYAGAAGETKTQMASVLHVPMGHLNQDKVLRWTDTELAAAYAHHRKAMAGSRKFELHIANALWGQEGFEFNKEYLKLVEKYFDGKLSNVDFAKAEQAAKTINNWVERQTKDKIKNLLSPGVLSSDTRLVLTNAIYFKAKWQNKFKKEGTRACDFHLSKDSKVRADMMQQTQRFSYGEVDGVKVLQMPYADSNMAMMILLPKEIDGLAELERQLIQGEGKKGEAGPGGAQQVGAFDKYVTALQGEQVRVVIPKFKFTSKFSLADTFKAMGMKLAFSGDADFSAMTKADRLAISNVIHQAFVEVDEEGTEAAAATAVIMGKGSAQIPNDEPKQFVADHPFIFVIRDTQSGTILFMGRVADPTK